MRETEFVARYYETDQIGIIHHFNYPKWFEAGRIVFKKLGVRYSKIEMEQLEKMSIIDNIVVLHK